MMYKLPQESVLKNQAAVHNWKPKEQNKQQFLLIPEMKKTSLTCCRVKIITTYYNNNTLLVGFQQVKI